jgi:uncharacterized damage-inducible protein DinB
MSDVDEQGRPNPPSGGDEAETLFGFLDFQRATFAWKCSGLDNDGLNATVGASSMTLGGMMKHLALVEDWWCTQWVLDRGAASPWDEVDFEADPDWEWRTAAQDSSDELFALWEQSVARSRASFAEALQDGGLEQRARRASESGWSPNLRWILSHMIEEYARHNGHADLIRESVDGQRGE